MTRSPPLLLIVAATAALAGVHSARASGPAVCNGKHKRPANPYGSVLALGLKPAPAPSASPGAGSSPPPVAKPLTVSRGERRASEVACGAAA